MGASRLLAAMCPGMLSDGCNKLCPGVLGGWLRFSFVLVHGPPHWRTGALAAWLPGSVVSKMALFAACSLGMAVR